MKGNDFLDYTGLEKYHDRLTSVLEDKFTWVKDYVDREISNIPEPEIPEIPEYKPILNVDRIKYESVGCGLIQPNSTSFGDSYYIDSEDYGYMYYGGPITEIPTNAFLENANLQKLYIPVGVTRIGDYAFSGCYSLTDVTIPDGVSDIGINAFYNTSLETVTIPNSVTYIAQGAFQGCQSLKYVTLSESLSDINQQTFADCYSLTSVTFGNSVENIGSLAFYGCSSLTSVTIPNSVTSIGNWAFSNCYSLTSVTIPNSVTSIGNGAFYYCSSLTSVTIGNSVTSIGDWAFESCRSLTSVTCLGTTPPTLNSDALPNSITSIFVHRQSLDQYKNDTAWGQYKDIIFPIEDDLSENTVNYEEFNHKMYSLKLGYDANNKIEIQVVKDLAYELSLSANPTYVWYGSSPTIAFTVTANDYTKGAAGWTFSAPAITSASYPALGPKETKTFSKAYADITADITGTLTQGTTSTVTVQCRKPIICSTSDIAANDRFTDFTKNAGYANQLGDFTFSGYIPAVTPLYIGVPGDKTYIKYKSGTSDNEAPRSKQVNISINGQSLSYSIFECNVTTGAEFKIYE